MSGKDGPARQYSISKGEIDNRHVNSAVQSAVNGESVPGRKNSLTTSQKHAILEFSSMWQVCSELERYTPVDIVFRVRVLRGERTKHGTERERQSTTHRVPLLSQDVDIRFDSGRSALALLPGETGLGTLAEVKDAKCKSEDPGTLLVTNLRVIWVDKGMGKHLNLSIGFGTMIGVKMNEHSSRSGGSLGRLELLCRFKNSKYHFEFETQNEVSKGRFPEIKLAWKAYSSSRDYRDLRLRSNVVRAGNLTKLPKETVLRRVDDVMNLANDSGNNGTFIITNLRIIWFAKHNESFNVTVPYVALLSVRIRNSKFGRALVLEATPRGGGHLLGFRLDPEDTMTKLFEEIRMIWKNALNGPNLGSVQYLDVLEQETKTKEMLDIIEDVDIVDCEDSHDTLLSYLLDPGTGASKVPTYSKELGVAIEPLKANVSLMDLWSVI